MSVPPSEPAPDAARAEENSGSAPERRPDDEAPDRPPTTSTVIRDIAGTIVIAVGVHLTASIVGPALLALVLVITVAPMSTWLRARRAPGWAAILVTAVGSYGILLALALALVVAVDKLVVLLPSYQSQFGNIVNDLYSELQQHGVNTESLQTALTKIDPSSVASAAQGLLGSLTSLFSALVFLLILQFFFVIESGSFAQRLRVVGRKRPHLTEALLGFARSTRRYMAVSTVFGIICALLDVVVLYLVDVPLPWMWGLLAFITNYIPNIGFVVGLVPPTLLALLQGGWSQAALVVLGYVAINIVIQSFIMPKFIGDAVGLTPSLTFVSLFLWTLVIGPLGALLAVPLSLLAKALLVDADPDRHWADILISGRDPDSS